MYNRRICPVQACRHLTLNCSFKVINRVPHITYFKRAYISLVIGPRGLVLEALESSDVVRFELGPFLQGQMRIAKLKSGSNSLIIFPRGS